ncbi:MAG: hypothetical protein GQ544_01890 [Candidatus Aminicenantes bacterium]|nr:hypothetical protein [Candidatus Aminicenantes bacterium]
MKDESKTSYARSLKDGDLSYKALKGIKGFITKDRGMRVEPFSEELLKQYKVTKHLSRLDLSICYRNRSWEGLIVGFPGNRRELSTQNVGTPYLRIILYPILDLYGKLRQQSPNAMPCLYLLGERFNDVFLRKFSFFKSLVAHVIVVTDDLRHCGERAYEVPKEPASKIGEYYLQKDLSEQMDEDKGLKLPVSGDKSIRAKFISYEVPTVAGNINPERLDVMGYDKEDNSLIAFELKGPTASKIELENLFLQGMEHRNWLEENKMAVRFAFDGPKMMYINTRKRVKLFLGFCGDVVPPLFHDLKAQALRRDKHLQIEFCRLIPPDNYGGKVKVGRFS